MAVRDDKPTSGLLRLCRAAAELDSRMTGLGYTEAQAMTVVRLYALSCLAPRPRTPVPYTEPTSGPPTWPDADDGF